MQIAEYGLNFVLGLIKFYRENLYKNDREITSNQFFYYTRCVTPNRATYLRDPTLRYWSGKTQLISKKFRSGGEPLVTQCSIWPVIHLKLRPPALDTNASLLVQQAGEITSIIT